MDKLSSFKDFKFLIKARVSFYTCNKCNCVKNELTLMSSSCQHSWEINAGNVVDRLAHRFQPNSYSIKTDRFPDGIIMIEDELEFID